MKNLMLYNFIKYPFVVIDQCARYLLDLIPNVLCIRNAQHNEALADETAGFSNYKPSTYILLSFNIQRTFYTFTFYMNILTKMDPRPRYIRMYDLISKITNTYKQETRKAAALDQHLWQLLH